MQSILIVAGLLLASALAGCSADDPSSDVQSVSTSTKTNAGSTTVSGSVSVGPGGAAGNGSVNDPNGNASAATAWSYDNRTGTVSGNGAIINVPFTKDEEFQVRNGTTRLLLNLSVDGSDLTLRLRSPDCTSEDCVQETKSAAGKASLDVNAPPEGQWLATLELDGTGPVQAEYTLEIAQLGPRA